MGRVMGILGVPMLVAPIVGPILGGWLVDDVSWRWIFFINLPIGVIAFILAQMVLEPDQPKASERLDAIGMVLLSPGLALLIFGLAESSTYTFSDARSWAPIVAGVVLIALFFRHSWRTPNALIDIQTFVKTRAGLSAIVFTLFAISFFGALLLIPLYYQSVRHASALTAGLLLVPQGLGAMVTMPIAGRLTDRYGPSKLPMLGIPLLIIGLLPFAFVTDHTSYVLLSAFNVVLGLGMGMSMMPTMTAAMQAVPRSAIARVSTAMNIIRQAGASIGTAVLTVILSTQINHKIAAIPGVHGGGGFNSVQQLPASVQAKVSAPLAEAFAHSFVWAIAMLAVALIPALVMAFYKPLKPSEMGGGPAFGDNEAELATTSAYDFG
jgi:EmrB/QacA subfamily drug resistance transporter